MLYHHFQPFGKAFANVLLVNSTIEKTCEYKLRVMNGFSFFQCFKQEDILCRFWFIDTVYSWRNIYELQDKRNKSQETRVKTKCREVNS